MGGFSLTHWIVVAILAILLLGRGRFSAVAGDLAKGLKTFRNEMKGDAEALPPRDKADEPAA